ncbi:MAG: 1-acyl-sn-glycerol-3-phosphate acyltransferase [Acidobacteriia bacterium]|nr:1-acyl-sn-glycerol-3-phosphate acyltransferase [Terriglobia bacterium]
MALLWSLIYVDPLIIASTVGFGIVSVVQSFFDDSGDSMAATARAWARSLVRITRVRVTVEGLEKIDPNRPYIFTANHLSYMDTPVVLSRISVRFRFMAKSELFKIPFLGTHLEQAGHIPVPLEDPRAAVKTLWLAAQTIREKGVSILIFPEGGRSEDGVLQEFKEGAAYIAIKAGVQIVPMALVGTREILAMHSKVFRPGPVTLRIDDPISTEGLKLSDRGELTAKIRERIVAMLNAGH